MLDQLKELLEMQRVLDETLMKEHGKTEYPLEETKIALFTELGEMMNELQTEFKWWKKHATYNREKALEEYVDCLHFALSLFNQSGFGIFNMYDYEKTNEGYDCYDISIVLKLIVTQGIDGALYWLFVLGNKFGFTWQEIYEAYKMKNAVNYDRLRNNY